MIAFSLGMENLPEQARKHARVYMSIALAKTLAFAIAEIFIVLYFISLLGFSQFSIVLSLHFLLQSLTDYPSGSLGDSIGQKTMLLMAYVLHGVSAFLMLISFSFYPVMFLYLIRSIGFSFESGALESWFDNYYHSTIIEGGLDEGRIQFGAFQTRLQLFAQLAAGLVFVIGGVVSDYTSRIIVIFIHLILVLGVLVLIIFLLPESKNERSNTGFNVLAGAKFVFQSKELSLFYIGVAMIWGVGGVVWASLMLFPFYEMYGINDTLTGLLRTLNFLAGILLSFILLKRLDKLRDEKLWFIIGQVSANPLFFVLVAVYFILLPPTSTFEIVRYTGVIILFGAVGLGDLVGGVFLNRIQLKIIPNDVRNSVYSLLPTMTTIIGLPLAVLAGYVIDSFGFLSGLIMIVVFTTAGCLISFLGLKAISLDTSQKHSSSLENPASP